MVSDRRRKATIEALLASREFLAAGFRSPELVDRTIVRLPREHRDVLRRFMVGLEQCLLTAMPAGIERGAAANAKSPRAATRRSMSPGRSPLEKPSVAFTEYRAAVVGSSPVAPAPEDLERFVDADFQRGLAHGEVRPMLAFLARFPSVERFLARSLVGETELFAPSSSPSSPGAPEADAQSPRGSDDEGTTNGGGAQRSGPLEEPQDSTASLAFHGSDTGSDCDGAPGASELVTVMEAFTQANMLWSQAFPVDLSAIPAHAAQIARLRRLESENASAADKDCRQAPQSTVGMLLRANLELHHPREKWEPLLALRDVAADELSAIAAELQRSGGADSSADDEVVAARGRLAIALTNCRDGLVQVSYRASPDDVKEALQQRLTHLLADTTSLSHSTGIAEAAAIPGASQQAKTSFFDRIKKGIAKRRDGPMSHVDEAELERLAHDMHRAQMAAKHYLKCIMNPAVGARPTAADGDDEDGGTAARTGKT
jgi:hypothetical protein